MYYTEEEIKRYMEILHKYTKPPEEKYFEKSIKSKCCNCQRDDCFSIYSGYRICENCSVLNGHVLGYHDYKDKDRVHFRNKSIYHRKYHYNKKVNQVSKIIDLNDEEKCEIMDRLMNIDNNIIEQLNKQFERKRMISIFYLIKTFLEEMGNEKHHLLDINISEQTQEFYEEWMDSYKKITRESNNSNVKKPVNNSS